MKLADARYIIELLQEIEGLVPGQGGSETVEELRLAVGTAAAAAHLCLHELRITSARGLVDLRRGSVTERA